MGLDRNVRLKKVIYATKLVVPTQICNPLYNSTLQFSNLYNRHDEGLLYELIFDIVRNKNSPFFLLNSKNTKRYNFPFLQDFLVSATFVIFWSIVQIRKLSPKKCKKTVY